MYMPTSINLNQIKVLTLRVKGIENTDQSTRGLSFLKTTAKRKPMNFLV